MATDALPGLIDQALDRFDLRTATSELLAVVAIGNREIERWKPWELVRRSDDDAQHQLDNVLVDLVVTCRAIGRELEPFLPAGADRILTQLGTGGTSLPAAGPVFAALEEG